MCLYTKMYLVLAAKLCNVGVTQMVLVLKTRRGHGEQITASCFLYTVDFSTTIYDGFHYKQW